MGWGANKTRYDRQSLVHPSVDILWLRLVVDQGLMNYCTINSMLRIIKKHDLGTPFIYDPISAPASTRVMLKTDLKKTTDFFAKIYAKKLPKFAPKIRLF